MGEIITGNKLLICETADGEVIDFDIDFVGEITSQETPINDDIVVPLTGSIIGKLKLGKREYKAKKKRVRRKHFNQIKRIFGV